MIGTGAKHVDGPERLSRWGMSGGWLKLGDSLANYGNAESVRCLPTLVGRRCPYGSGETAAMAVIIGGRFPYMRAGGGFVWTVSVFVGS
jgi:hypothetical protein